jgi:hypothetical protein
MQEPALIRFFHRFRWGIFLAGLAVVVAVPGQNDLLSFVMGPVSFSGLWVPWFWVELQERRGIGKEKKT